MIVGSGWASLTSIGQRTGWKFISRLKNAAEKQNCFFLGAADTAVHTKTRSQGIHILLEGKNVKRKQTFKINSE